ncbi:MULTISPECIES: XDD4 family exosortase-dependent surface protein [unclassified Nostoc]|uniref:XDD4 family exosortase-dependent surface protein n=1 Tax=unclassified Nostoc TaxID=2593658 RepID=UPI002AD36C50|nr:MULTISPECIES: XDD4 family exosortase-dependent surface protein [unclassified Nostoc]MDZ8121001.1 PEP-CTERM sorting domain-containing protein [Nostoc sp. CmiVER01]MDZ8223725.1 PEP-CTERM sorting domain-containing protein [Nostoc sp. ChiVER01]
MSQLYSKKIVGYAAYCISTLAVVISQMPRADAASMTFSATGTNPISGGSSTALSAKAVFDDSIAGKLTLTLTNTGPGASAPSDVLTGIFWDYAGSPLTNLTLSSAKAPTVIKNNVTTGTNVDLTKVGGNTVEWGFAKTTASTGLGGASGVLKPVTQHYGIGTAGFGISPGFGLSGGQQFNYGIITGYDSPNSAVSGGTFVKDSATFVFSGLPTGFDLTKIQNIRFQYGTGLDEPSTYYIAPPPPPKRVPESNATVALGLFALGALRVAKKKPLVSA